KTHYDILSSGRWQNIYNDVKVTFGVEADLLNANGDICTDIQGITPEFIILSAHRKVFATEPGQIKSGFLNAITRFGKTVNMLGHLCTRQFAAEMDSHDILEIVDAANENDIALELNCANLVYGKTDLAKLKLMIKHTRFLYVNSDAHTMNEFITIRRRGFQFLENEIIL
ncbi:MAG: hypothetical protein KAK01_06145, partial [Candidatus Marinimicrobia bacterium]|nr:hypothetical protein [Candidatus Neomarinimicrobiota bacterium]